jgi:hypothetical protein
MTKKIVAFLKIIFLITLTSCDSDKKETLTYFGGKIINPKSNHVVLFSLDKVIDTFYLDKKNKFIGKLNNIDEGLYYFFHGDENQYIYIKPKDSIMLRLNTWDFDESLVFAGEGAERNNILIDCFLEDEKDRKVFYGYNKLEPKQFKQKSDSLAELKLKTYYDYLKNHPKETEAFGEVLKISLMYPVYARVEKYPIIYAKYSKNKSFPALDTLFFNYRNDIKINKESLMYYPPYSRYVKNYLYNETYSLGHPPVKNTYSSKFTLDLLNTIDKNIVTEKSKNVFLKQTLISHFYNKSSCNINKEPFDKFFELSTSEEDKKHIQQIINDSKAVVINQKIQDFNVIDYSNSTKSINDIIKGKSTMLFFWNPEYYSERYIVSRIKYLSTSYPNIKFIQIKIDDANTDRIKNIDIKDQFYIDKNSEAQTFLTSRMPRCILVDNKGTVTNGYASFSSYNINPHLEALNEIN